jgi:hypothetical protein
MSLPCARFFFVLRPVCGQVSDHAYSLRADSPPCTPVCGKMSRVSFLVCKGPNHTVHRTAAERLAGEGTGFSKRRIVCRRSRSGGCR